MSRPARAHIDLGALSHNLARVRACAPGRQVLAVIKANGYGHGLARVARALHGADGFGVASIDEALALRAAGVHQPILLLEGFFSPDELPLIQQYALDTVVHCPEQLEQLLAQPFSAANRLFSVWLKIDSGMHRLGFAPEQACAAWERLSHPPLIAKPVRLMTHLANADVPDDPQTVQQLACFASTTQGWPGEHSIANSAGILAFPHSHGQWVRPGIMLYGVSPFPDRTGVMDGLRPVMTVRSRLIAVRALRRGDAVGYGGAWVCPEDMPVGFVAFGYGDGYPRHAQPGTPVLVNGQRAPLIGRVSMDMLCVDLRGQHQTQVGDPVVLWGEGLPVEEIATHASTIPYEILCGVAARVPVVEMEGARVQG